MYYTLFIFENRDVETQILQIKDTGNNRVFFLMVPYSLWNTVISPITNKRVLFSPTFFLMFSNETNTDAYVPMSTGRKVPVFKVYQVRIFPHLG